MSLAITDDERNKRSAAILHLVNDYTNLVAAGTLIYESLPAPVNTYVQYSFLLECRKFSDFFRSRRGPFGRDMAADDFVAAELEIRLDQWDQWRKHMNAQLIHLSYDRIDNKTEWTGHPVNRDLLAEFMAMWRQFLDKLDDDFRREFATQLEARSRKPEFKRFSFT